MTQRMFDNRDPITRQDPLQVLQERSSFPPTQELAPGIIAASPFSSRLDSGLFGNIKYEHLLGNLRAEKPGAAFLIPYQWQPVFIPETEKFVGNTDLSQLGITSDQRRERRSK
jgi:hypothetical protein